MELNLGLNNCHCIDHLRQGTNADALSPYLLEVLTETMLLQKNWIHLQYFCVNQFMVNLTIRGANLVGMFPRDY